MAAPHQHLTEPLEKRSLGVPLLALTLALLAGTLWALQDEMEARRPWKAIQREYRQKAVERMDAEIEQRRRLLADRDGSEEGRRLKAALWAAEAELAPDRPAGRRLAAIGNRLAELTDRIEAGRAEIRRLNGRKLLLESKGAAPNHPQLAGVAERLATLDRELAAREVEGEGLRVERARITAKSRRARRLFQAPLVRLQAAVKRREALAGRIPGIQELTVPTGEVERCTTCHLAMGRDWPGLDRLPYTAHPGDHLRHHPPDRFGCTACHGGYGTALDNLAAPHGFEPSMPRELRRGRMAQGSCVRCHRVEGGRDRRLFRGELPGAETLATGLKAYERHLCQGCHTTPGFDPEVKTAPPLDTVPLKLSPELAAEWIRDPAKARADARMPRFHLAADGSDVNALVAYIWSLPRPRHDTWKWPAWMDKDEDDLEEEELDAQDRLIDTGAKAWTRVQCAVCHARDGKGGDAGVHAPDLSRIGPRVGRRWLRLHLEDPAALFPDTRMPGLNLPEPMVRGLVVSILRDPEYNRDDLPRAPRGKAPAADPALLRRGRELVRDLGCGGCHTVPGHENDPPVGNDLGDYGDKRIDQLDFGVRTDLVRTVETWTRVKVASPRSFDPKLIMPVPNLQTGEAAAMTALLLGYTGRPLPAGWRPPTPEPIRTTGEIKEIFDRRRCLTCHSLGGRGGDYAPELGHQGSRTRPEWLATFLKNPTSIRPRLVQMPQMLLTALEIDRLGSFFTIACREPRLETLPDLVPRPFEDFDLKTCLPCHRVEGGGGVLAPDLEAMGERLRKPFLYHWLRGPRRIDRDVLMPCTVKDPRTARALAERPPGMEGGDR